MATESSDKGTEDGDRSDRRVLIQRLVKRDMERNPDIYEVLARE